MINKISSVKIYRKCQSAFDNFPSTFISQHHRMHYTTLLFSENFSALFGAIDLLIYCFLRYSVEYQYLVDVSNKQTHRAIEIDRSQILKFLDWGFSIFRMLGFLIESNMYSATLRITKCKIKSFHRTLLHVSILSTLLSLQWTH